MAFGLQQSRRVKKAIVAQTPAASGAARTALRYTACSSTGSRNMGAALTMLGSIVVAALTLLGIAGTAYHVFREDGLLSRATGALWEAHYEAPATVVLVLLAAVFVVKALAKAHKAERGKSNLANIILYIFIVTGAVFLGRFLMTGSI
jgi:hypothetical protein